MTLGIGASMFSTPGSGYFSSQSFGEPKLSSTFPDKVDQIDPLQNQLCRVCEEPAAGFHFGAFTCEGCKSFFGRTCNNQSVIQECKNSYRCVVDKKNRTACKACRLRKCLMVGMSKSGSRYGRRSNWFKIHCLMQQNMGKSGSISHPPPPPPPRLPSPPNHIAERSLPPTISWPPTSSPLLSPIKTEISRPSRSPSPLHISLNSDKSSPSPISSLSPRKISDISPRSDYPFPLIPTPTSLPALYGFPPPLPFLSSHPFPFYRLSPLLAGNPFLANSLLFSMAGQKSPPEIQKEKEQSHLDLLKEHQTLLETYAALKKQPGLLGFSGYRPEHSVDNLISRSEVETKVERRGVSGETPMDLTVRMDKKSEESRQERV